jgi:uncharacterized damage-inducible protein DinB
MEYKKYFTGLFKYDNWANKNIAEIISTNYTAHEKPLFLFSHIINSQIIWLERIRDNVNLIDPFIKRSAGECASLSEKVNNDWLDFIEETNEDFFNSQIHYKSTDGINFISCLKDIITHVINHSTYHRAQIATALKNEGIIPPVTDYIAYSRIKEQ